MSTDDWFRNGTVPTWKLRNQIFESRIENVRIWSMNGFAFRANGGTPNTFEDPTSVNMLTIGHDTGCIHLHA